MKNLSIVNEKANVSTIDVPSVVDKALECFTGIDGKVYGDR